jgi:ligand-binding sensor domain-containing protein
MKKRYFGPGSGSGMVILCSILAILLVSPWSLAGVLTYNSENTCLPSNRVHNLVSDTHGGFIAAVDGGAVSFRGIQIDPLDLPDGSSGWCLTDIETRGSDLFVATANRGLWVKRNGKWISATREDARLPVSGMRDLAIFSVPGLEKSQEDFLFLATDAGLGILPLGKNGTDLDMDRISIPGDSVPVNCLCSCPDGVWVGTLQGAYLYHPVKGIVRTLSIDDGLPSPCINSIAFSDGRVWFATDAGLVRFLGSEYRIYNSENAPLAHGRIVSVTPLDGGVLVATTTSVHRISREVFKEYDLGMKPAGPISSAILLAYQDGSDDLWVSTVGTGLIRFCSSIRTPALARRATRLSVAAPGDSPRVEYTSEDGLPEGRITSIAVDNESFSGRKLIWLGTDSGPVSFDGTMFTLYDSEVTGLRDSSVTSLQVAGPPGYRFLWVSTRTGGLVRYDGSAWKVMSGKSGPGSDSVYSLALSERGLWAATHIGASWLGQNGIWVRYSRENGLVSDKVYGVATAPGDGGTWFAAELGLSHFRDGRFTSYSQWDGLPGFRYISILPVSDREVWAGSYRDGAVRWDGRDFIHYDRHLGLDGKRVNSLVLHEGSVVAATESGVFVFTGSRFEKRSFNYSGEALFIASDGAYLWVATRMGLYRFLFNGNLKADN